jgi:hypothetical protein
MPDTTPPAFTAARMLRADTLVDAIRVLVGR